MASNPTTHVWPTFLHDAAVAAIGFLTTAFGFTVSIVVPNDDDPTVIEHAQLLRPEGGGIMLGSSNRPGDPFSQRATGAGSSYVVAAHPDDVYKRAMAGGAIEFAPLEDADHGGRGFSVIDPEGNIWSLGSYIGE